MNKCFELGPRQGLMTCETMGAISSISNTAFQILILNLQILILNAMQRH